MFRKHRYLMAYMLVLAVFSVYVVLDTFVITRVYGDAAEPQTGTEEVQDSGDESGGSGDHRGKPGGHGGPGGHGSRGMHKGSRDGSGDSSGSSKSKSSKSSSDSSSSSASSGSGVSTGSYSKNGVSIELEETTVSGSTVHVATVSLDSASSLKTAMAQGSYGKNVTDTTSSIAEENDAILAINGDYYGSRESGYVIRNGKLYRSTSSKDQEDLVIYKDGSFGIINESDVSAEELINKGAVQTLSFGPALVENGRISVDEDSEVRKATGSNPRTAIGIKEDGTYIFVVSDGRTDESDGLSLYELADFMKSQGAVTAYNLDGGGSSTMVFQGSIVNTPTGGGIGNGSGSERKVSDIVYIG